MSEYIKVTGKKMFKKGTIVECHGVLTKRDADIEYRIVT